MVAEPSMMCVIHQQQSCNPSGTVVSAPKLRISSRHNDGENWNDTNCLMEFLVSSSMGSPWKPHQPDRGLGTAHLVMCSNQFQGCCPRNEHAHIISFPSQDKQL